MNPVIVGKATTECYRCRVSGDSESMMSAILLPRFSGFWLIGISRGAELSILYMVLLTIAVPSKVYYFGQGKPKGSVITMGEYLAVPKVPELPGSQAQIT
ncbi:hypothetical protein AG1IA_09998 [Rhizoctonia solani AG-1 IA]|uniref:Uncharacterized protein n=1 Tax=Thanatephorus cucumeris (strain AG1-IA) TaxID=983506 RepID=L8WGW9_THACA|nr:hypothetical protein AG1IA_09998 [Rhizoctonia solani AG-1 IA]